MKILFITNKNFIGCSNFGGAQCAKRNYELLSTIYGKENVQYIIFSDEIQSDRLEEGNLEIKINASNIVKYFNLLFWRDCFSVRAKRKIADQIHKINPDVVFFDGSSFGYIGKLLPPNVKKIVFYHNIEKRYAWSRVINTSLLCIIKFFSFWMNEKYITQNADIRICLNERDENLLYDYYSVKADFLLPISFDDVGEYNVFSHQEKKDELLFVGSYFMPNIKGITWFCKKVMPYVDKKLVIVGKNMELLKSQLETEKVKVVGTVDDLGEYYKRADALVMPIFVGDGMKVKTAEAMMYGKPMFATNEALEGYKVDKIKGICRCNNSADFIENINKQTITGYCDEIRKLFLEKYSTEAVQRQLEKFI